MMRRSVSDRAGSMRENATPIAALSFIAAGGLATAYFGGEPGGLVWTVGLVATGTPLLWTTLRGMANGTFAADLVASLAIGTALALDQPLVGLVIVLMQSGGEALERLAEGKATEALRALESAVPRWVHLVRDGVVSDIDAAAVTVGDRLLVRPGEMIPCDGEVVSGRSHVDTSTLTGEPVPVLASTGAHVMSGSVNQEGAILLRAEALVGESQYARIVELVREAQASKAPLQRVADKYAVWFTPLTIVVCAIAYFASGEWNRVLAVLAIATPCPLILATPVAILGGMNRAARRHIIMRNGGALESLGSVTAAVFDKTGTITIGRPRVARIIVDSGSDENELLRIAAAVEQMSGHLLARTIVEEAAARGLNPPDAAQITESPGQGVEGDVDGRRVAVGARSFITRIYPGIAAEMENRERLDADGASLRAYVAVDGNLAGMIDYADMIRPGVPEFVRSLRGAGIKDIVLLSGDRSENAQKVGATVGIDDARGDLLPEGKVAAVREMIARGESVVMIGDGTNDAPALTAATVGVALASHGRGIATEAADVILMADDPLRLLDAIHISRRTMRIARQSILAGLGISAVGMVAAAAGMIPPIAGALLQEAVDVAVIANALRASGSGKTVSDEGFEYPEPVPGLRRVMAHNRSAGGSRAVTCGKTGEILT